MRDFGVVLSKDLLQEFRGLEREGWYGRERE